MNKSILDKNKEIIKLIRLYNPTGWILLAMPGLWMFTANKILNIRLVTLWILGSFIARSAGCIINDYIDKDIDKKVKRTKNRPLCQGKIKLKEILLLIIALGSGGIYITYLLDPQALKILAIIIPGICLYPLSKKFFSLPQIVLAIVFGSSVFIANKITNDNNIILWYLANIFWIFGFDSVYSYSDLEDDRKLNINSAPKTLGKNLKLVIILSYVLFLTMLLIIKPASAIKDFICITICFYLLINQAVNLENNNPQTLFKQNIPISLIILIYFI